MHIVVLDGHTLNPGDLDWSALKELGTYSTHPRTAADEVIARAAEAEVILTNKVQLSAEIMAALPKLKYIGVLATGYNIVDLEA
ncbi:MAG: D-2-hydroxyacid dehydrogenase, partial [Deltaproteobacteria bacterium]|nr:D-2-hydroxyacid dehydrogenase [Deltaproteobacteria bacterium]